MKRPPRLAELLFLLFLISGLAFLTRSKPEAPKDLSYQQMRLTVQNHWKQGDLKACGSACDALLRSEPGDLFALRYLGLLALRQGDRALAERYFDEGLGQSTRTPVFDLLSAERRGALLREKARLLLTAGRWDEALKLAEQAKESMASYTEDHDLACDVACCALVGKGEIDSAREQYPSPGWSETPIQGLIHRHRSILEGKPEPARADEAWHPQPCPICALEKH